MLIGSVEPTSGDAWVGGLHIVKDREELRSSLGLCPQFDVLYDEMTPAEQLRLYGGMAGLSEEDAAAETDRLLELLKMTFKANEPVRTLSGGQKRRISLATALIGNPRRILLDEPTTGMDPANRRGVWKVLQEQKQAGVNVVDTAANYRRGRGEVAVGRALRDVFATGLASRDEILVSTKAGFLTTPDSKSAARSAWAHAAMVVPASLLFFGLGTALYVFYASRPGEVPVAGQTDIIVPWFIVQQLPAGFAGLVIAGLFAATMSSVDSGMHSIATTLTNDVYSKLCYVSFAGDATLLATSRQALASMLTRVRDVFSAAGFKF